jgi:FAD/FMN-containing dehydrogenase/Fe-S oxidoreductase
MNTTGRAWRRSRATGDPVPGRRAPSVGHSASSVDRLALAAELRGHIEGEVRFGDGDRALYATDGSNYRQVPIGVVVPRTIDDVVTTVATARRFGAPVLPRGGGTSLAGQCCNVAVVIDLTKYVNRLLEMDPVAGRARVESGIVLDELRKRTWPHHLTFGPDPSTHTHCALGGMIGNNSCGVHSVLSEFYGPGPTTAHSVQELDILTYDGLRMRVGPTSDTDFARVVAEGGRRAEIYRGLKSLRDRYAGEIRRRFPDIPRRVSGYNLPALLPEHGFDVARALVGSEGTCVTVLEATLTLTPYPPARSLLALGYPSVYEAGDHIPEIRQFKPIGLEGLDDVLIAGMKKKHLHPHDVDLLPLGAGWLLVEFGGDTKDESDGRAHALMAALRLHGRAPSMKLFDDPKTEQIIWKVRESGLGATARIPGERDTWEGWEDSAVPPAGLGDYLRGLRALFVRYGYRCALYGHFGQGCVHTRIDFDLVTQPGIDMFRAFLDDAAELVLRHGGSLSGEHGDGQSRAELLPKMFGPELMRAFREFKAIWDPEGRMNPHKIVDPYRITENLRLGADYAPTPVTTHFAFPEEDGSFARATTRCVGVGECRRHEGGTMCPSYMVTREERHSTRGRARLLFEMLEGDPVRAGWRDAAVRDALDLCLACKGCKSDCPVNVDMATYKAEFLSHYYAGRLRPPSAYAMGLVSWWARLGSLAPGVANALTAAPVLGGLFKALAGIAPARRVPRFAPETFTQWFRRRGASRPGGRGRVLLWPDTFTNHFYPQTARAAVTVLEAAGYTVSLPPRSLCCGRPLYDYGMLTLARRMLRQILDTLRPVIRAGTPVVGLEPSCVAVVRDEMGNLLPHDLEARRLRSQVFTLAEFLDRAGYAPPPIAGKALVHGHCHHKSIMTLTADEKLFQRLGLDTEIVDAGCCGMAGSFGFERDHYAVSVAVGEQSLLPRVRGAASDTLVVADGFSCREQIAQLTGRRALHLAEVIEGAIRGTLAADAGPLAETRPAPPRALAIVAAAGALLVATAAWQALRRRSPAPKKP